MENTQASTAITSSPLGKLQKSRLRKWRDESTRMAALRMLRDGSPMSAIRRTLKVSKSCVYRWYRQWEQERTLSCKKPPGPARKFTDAVAELVVEHLAQHPSSTARQLIAATGAPVKENAIYRNLRRLGITHKKAEDMPVNWPTAEHIEDIRTYLETIATVPKEKRVYMDESFSHLNAAPTRGWARRGRKVRRHRERQAQRYMFAIAIRLDGLVHPPAISRENMSDDVFMRYVRAHLVPNLREGDVVIWDRLGKAGRAKNPSKQHYNPEAKALIEAKGARVVFLPPKGKHFNPIELFFGKAKKHIEQSFVGSLADREGRHRRDGELIRAIMEGCASVTPKDIAGYFRERSDDRAFKKEYPSVEL